YFGWMFLYAGVVSYSRIYLAKHYPLDILCGILLGKSSTWSPPIV
ncbi:MAG: phosphatase PAP2 family protein, partial [Kordiimonadaceae bacterium]|nr:phosphatase PAP2 family protein [Kordiimonadaceae bacterium]